MHLAFLHEGRPALLRVEGPSGAPVALFLHPFPLHADCWDEVLRACASSGICAAALDTPGFGGTPPWGEPVTMDKLAELGACALDTLGARKAAVVGCSMGGYAALAFAERFPERLSAVALLSSRANADTAQGKENREKQALLALEKGSHAVLADFVPKLLAPNPPPELLHHVAGLAARATAQGIADAHRGMALRPDRTPQLANWKWPTLVVVGEQDQIISRAESMAMANAIPGARVQVMKAGHLPMLEAPRELIPLLVSHLQLRIHG
jgi:pimeloyl-ACP methyl ester carboxylesterase